jgi:hypothetical protein
MWISGIIRHHLHLIIIMGCIHIIIVSLRAGEKRTARFFCFLIPNGKPLGSFREGHLIQSTPEKIRGVRVHTERGRRAAFLRSRGTEKKYYLITTTF